MKLFSMLSNFGRTGKRTETEQTGFKDALLDKYKASLRKDDLDIATTATPPKSNQAQKQQVKHNHHECDDD